MIHLKLVTLSGVKFDGDVHEVVLPTMTGQIGVLTDHMPLISAATAGIISIKEPKRYRLPDGTLCHIWWGYRGC